MTLERAFFLFESGGSKIMTGDLCERRPTFPLTLAISTQLFDRGGVAFWV